MTYAAFTFDHLGTAAQMGALCEVVARHDVPTVFFVTGEQAAADPQGVRALVDAGIEVGMHGWAHERWSDLDPVTERELATRATDAIAAAAGAPPRGFRAPGGTRSAATAEILGELGYQYDASLGDGMRVARLDNGLAQVPFVWPGVDGYWYLRDAPEDPANVRDAWLRSLDKAAARGALFLTICHPEITGADAARIAALEAVIAVAVTDSRVTLVLPVDVV